MRILAISTALLVMLTIAWLPISGMVTKQMSIEQSRDFAAGIRIQEKVHDGFFAVDLKVPICDDGSFCSTKAATLIDRAKDSVLTEWISVHLPKLQRKASIEQLTEITRSVSKQFTPSPPITDAELDCWYETFCSKYARKCIPIGTFIDEKKGCCQQRAILLKVLCDAANVSCSLVPGYDCNGGRHVWCEIVVDNQIKIFDPTWGVFGATANDLRYFSAERKFGEKCFQLREILPRICAATLKQDTRSLLPAYIELLQIDESIFGEETLETSIDHHNLAAALLVDQNYPEAIKHAECAWRIQAKHLSENDEHTKQSAALLQLLLSKWRDNKN